jgi:hypothetical protein
MATANNFAEPVHAKTHTQRDERLAFRYTTLNFDLFFGVDNPKNRQSYIVSTSSDNDT